MERLERDIEEISNNIRKKYRDLKHGIRASEELLTKTYKPILTPLEMISHKLEGEEAVLKKKKIPKKVEEKEEEDVLDRTVEPTRLREETVVTSTPRFITTDVVAETPTSPDVTVEDIMTTPEGRQRVQEYVETVFKGPLARQYLHLTLSDERVRLMDHTYGVRNFDGKWMVGNSVLEIDDDDSLHIAGKRYTGTPGLYELLFMKHPDENVYNVNDLAAYKSILKDTNAHKHYYLPGARINTNKSYKYREVIAKLFPSRSGRGHRNLKTTSTMCIRTIPTNW